MPKPTESSQPTAAAEPGSELAATRQALAAAERQLEELRAWHSEEMARLQRQTYWLERWRIDLDSLMSRRLVRVFVATVGRVLHLVRRLRGSR